MRRSWRGRYRNNWYRNKNRPNDGNDNNSLNNSSASARASTAASSRAPANQLPIVVPINPCNVWKLYFPSDEYPSAENDDHLKVFKTFIEKTRSSFDLEKIDLTRSIPLDVQVLTSDSEFNTGWPSFSTDLYEKPEFTLRLLEYCLHETLKCESKIKVRILNHQPVIPLSNLKIVGFHVYNSNNKMAWPCGSRQSRIGPSPRHPCPARRVRALLLIWERPMSSSARLQADEDDETGKMVTIKGTVIKVGSVGLICTSMAFECSSCHSLQAIVQPQGVFTAPNICQSCKGGVKFEPLQSSPYTNTTDWQVAKIQEIQSQSASGTIPRSVEIELQGDLVGTACPGDVLSVTGIVQVRGESRGGEDGKRAARLLQLYIEAVSIHSQRNLSNPTLAFTLKDYYAIQEIHGSEDVFRLLVHSLCPTIFGQEAVKAGLILGLLGGTEQEGGARCNPHVLVVGDPGLGKSQLLQAAAHAAPRGVYVCGASASAGGLTVALGREAGGDFALEAGALVLADRGVCCVDELDKMSAHHSSLLEAMEQCRVSVAKGGVVCSLAARATVLAAANPACGSYNRAKTVAENLKINSALLSRFDLVFILLDQPDEKIDAMLSEHVLALHSGLKRKKDGNSSKVNVNIDTSQSDTDASLSFAVQEVMKEKWRKLVARKRCEEFYKPKIRTVICSAHFLESDVKTTVTGIRRLKKKLFRVFSKRLRLKPGEVIDTLPVVLLRKYIAYARRYVHPKLSTEAANALQNFYLELRHNHQDGSDGTPITTRQLEACIRLTQARARAELREEATMQDANDVISLVKHSLMDTFSDEFGNIQLSRSINGSGVSSRNKLKKFLDALTRRSHQLGKDVFTRQELIQIHKAAGVAGDANDLIEAMHIHSYLLLKGSNTYQLVAI